MTTWLAAGSIVETLARLATPWKDLYDDSTALSVSVVFVHLAAMLVGGGLALAADQATLRALRGSANDRERHLAQLALTHRTIIGALVISFASGVLLLLADIETFAVSIVYWTKMGLVAALLVNGLLMTRVEGTLRRGAAADEARAWGRLRTTALVSGFLWLATLLAGVALTSA